VTYGQLSYTSYDARQGGRGGWQVKETAGPMTEAEQQRAIELVTTRLDPVDTPPRFPSPEEIAAVPRRLLVDVDDVGGAMLVHTAFAGSDASGRPGNVFNHVLSWPDLSGMVLGGSPRPLELWRSPDWLTPHGTDAVREAALPTVPLRHGGVVSRTSIAAFLSDPRSHRAQGLGALVDAVAAALQGGPHVLVTADDQDTAVLWLAAVSFMTSPLALARLSMSSYERVYSLRSSTGSALVSAIPRADVVSGTGLNDYVLIDPDSQSAAGPAGWHTASGAVVSRTPWSTLVAAVATNPPEVVADRLLALDELCDLNPGAARSHDLWPLAVAVAESDAAQSGWVAAAEILAEVPLRLVDDEVTRSFVASVTARAEPTPPPPKVMPVAPPTPPAVAPEDLAWTAGALADPEFLLGEPWPPPAVQPLDRERNAALLQAMSAQFVTALATMPAQQTDIVQLAALTLRILDLAALTGVAPLLADDPVFLAARAQLAQLLRGPSGGAIISAAGWAQPDTLKSLSSAVSNLLALDVEPPGSRLDPAVAAWFLTTAEPNLTGYVNRAGADQLLDELLVHAVRRAPTRTLPLRRAAALVLMQNEFWLPDGVDERRRANAALDSVKGPAYWDPEELVTLLKQTAGRADLDLQDAVVETLLLFSPGQELLVTLANTLLTSQPERLTEPHRLLAELHSHCGPHWWVPGSGSWSSSAQILVCGLQLWQQEFLQDEARTLVRPVLTTAAVRSILWRNAAQSSAEGPALREHIEGLAGLLPDLMGEVGPSLDLLLDNLRMHESLAVGAMASTWHVSQRSRLEPKPPDSLDLFATPAGVHEEADLGGGCFGEILLRRFLAPRPDATAWVNKHTASFPGLDDHGRELFRAWAIELTPEHIRARAPYENR
jgi:hypothetical protein